MRRIGLRLSLLTLALTLFALPAFAGGRGAGPARVPSGLDRVWQALVRLVPALAEGRGTIDPDGGGGPGTATSSPDPGDPSDGRSTIDPDGRDPNG
jgi:hypothetical protein